MVVFVDETIHPYKRNKRGEWLSLKGKQNDSSFGRHSGSSPFLSPLFSFKGHSVRARVVTKHKAIGTMLEVNYKEFDLITSNLLWDIEARHQARKATVTPWPFASTESKGVRELKSLASSINYDVGVSRTSKLKVDGWWLLGESFPLPIFRLCYGPIMV